MIIIFMPMSLGYQGHISSYLFLIPLQVPHSAHQKYVGKAWEKADIPAK